MDTVAVLDEIAAAMRTVPGLVAHTFDEPPSRMPAALIALPDRIEYHATYRRGSDAMKDVVIMVLVGTPKARTSGRLAAAYTAGTGVKSVVARLDAYAWTLIDTPTVVWSEFEVVSVSGTDYLSATFHVDLIGRGA